MLKKKQRLSRSEFQTLVKKGRRVHGEHITLTLLPAKDMKCGVVVSKKTAKNATARNLLRRRVYEVFGGLLPALTNLHVAVFTRPVAANISFKDLQDEIANLVVKKR